MKMAGSLKKGHFWRKKSKVRGLYRNLSTLMCRRVHSTREAELSRLPCELMASGFQILVVATCESCFSYQSIKCSCLVSVDQMNRQL